MRGIFQAQLLGQELALWRDDAGSVNAWENRCPHRGVRLSIGFNVGKELRCQYHGWRFATGTGRCSFIPAHPTQRPAATMCVATFAVAERHGALWVNLAAGGGSARLPELAAGPVTTLRSVFVDAPAAAVAAALLHGYRLDGDAAAEVTTLDGGDALALTAGAVAPGRVGPIVFHLQPVTDHQVVIHGFLLAVPSAERRLAELRRHNAALGALRDAVERAA